MSNNLAIVTKDWIIVDYLNNVVAESQSFVSAKDVARKKSGSEQSVVRVFTMIVQEPDGSNPAGIHKWTCVATFIEGYMRHGLRRIAYA